jgi:3-oxoacyl-[acyl-carrier protein] reductase
MCADILQKRRRFSYGGEQRQVLLQKIPVRRFCDAEEVAHTVRFLAHPLSGFITGEIIDQNGGLQFD